MLKLCPNAVGSEIEPQVTQASFHTFIVKQIKYVIHLTGAQQMLDTVVAATQP